MRFNKSFVGEESQSLSAGWWILFSLPQPQFPSCESVVPDVLKPVSLSLLFHAVLRASVQQTPRDPVLLFGFCIWVFGLWFGLGLAWLDKAHGNFILKYLKLSSFVLFCLVRDNGEQLENMLFTQELTGCHVNVLCV